MCLVFDVDLLSLVCDCNRGSVNIYVPGMSLAEAQFLLFLQYATNKTASTKVCLLDTAQQNWGARVGSRMVGSIAGSICNEGTDLYS